MKNTNPTEDVWTLRKKAGALRKAQRYEEALEPYRMLWEQSTQQDAWDGWGYAFCLEKTGQTTPALEVCRKAHELDPEHELVRQLYARCLYYVEVRSEQTSLGRQMQAARLIGELVAQDDPYAPYLVPSILHVATALKERGRFRDVLEWLDRLDPSRLSTEPFQLEEKGRTIKIPSEATRYWLLRCKALFRTGDFAGCREAVEQALQQVPRPVNDADLWWRRLKALAQAVEGDLETAYRELSRLAARKPAWFLEEDLARIARKQGNHDVAWRHLLRVLLDRSPLRLRVNAVERAAAWYEEEGEAERARQTLALVLAMRREEGWPVKGTLRERVQALQVQPAASVREAERSLRQLWQEHLDRLDPRHEGEIASVLPGGKAGFVRTADGQSYFFRASELKGARLQPGLRVSFRTAPGFDRKKQKATIDAIDLRPQR